MRQTYLLLASLLLNDLSKALPNLGTDIGLGISHHLVEVDCKKLALFTDLLATDKDGVHIASGNTKVKLPWEVASVKRSRWMIVKKKDIGEATSLKTTNGVLEELAGNEGVVAEEKVERLHGANTRILGLKLVDEAAATVLLKHIIGHTISAETNADALCNHVTDARNTDSIVLVALRVSHDVGVSASDDIDFVVAQEHTVANDGVLTKNAELLKTRDAAHAMDTHALILIILTLSNVNVETSVHAREVLAELFDLLDGLLESLIAAGERCVETEGGTKKRVLLSCTLAHEADVLLDTLLGAGDAITVSDLVAEASTSTALSGTASNLIKRANDVIRAGVVVNDASSTTLESLSSEDLGAEVVGILIKSTIQTPPETLENLKEGLRSFINETHTTRVETIIVTMATDETRNDIHSLSINALSALRNLCEDLILRTNSNDHTVLH